MEEIKIFKVSDYYLDGGSRDEIITNIGTFKLVKKIGNPNNNNGFYKDCQKVEKEIEGELKNSLEEYLEEIKLKSVEQALNNFNMVYGEYGYKVIKE